MSVSILSPLLYLLIGIALGRLRLAIKEPASASLTRVVIPLVIIYNIATYRPGVFAIIVGIVVIMATMLLFSRCVTRDALQSLCFFYLNIGWLGLPIAGTLFGDGAATVIVAAYVGSSLFGNSVGVGLLAGHSTVTDRLLQTLRAPPISASIVGIACIPFGDQIASTGRPFYDALKFVMGFLGMAILGIWLSTTRVTTTDFKKAVAPFLARLVTVSVLMTAFIAVCRYAGIGCATENQPALYLIGLLPPAANIIVLETHYLKSGRSATMIACGTCISVVAVGMYAAGVLLLRSPLQ